MEIMDADGKATRIRDLQEKRDHLRQQLASLENELASLQGSPGMEGADVAIEEGVVCKHFCAHHPALADPAVWRCLPEELLQMVFARLPLRQILRLQCLSKAWRWNVTAKESGFRRLCGSAASSKSKMFALVDEACEGMGIVSIKLFDGEAQRWSLCDMILQPRCYWETMSVSDGGLVCFVSKMLDKEAYPLLIVVLNPLTKEYKVLPALASLSRVQPQMVQIIMDHGTNCYKVIVVGNENRRNRSVLAEVYSSSTGTWSNADSMPSDLVCGYHFRWEADGVQLCADRGGPCAYACRESQLLKLGDHFNPSLDSCTGYALLNDRLFVLQHETRNQRRKIMVSPDVQGYRVSSRFVLLEYRGQKNSPYWVRVRYHDCTPLERPSSGFTLSEHSRVVLHACGDSLMITADNLIMLYDLSTYEWQQIPAVPGDEDQQPCIQAAMCELRLDAVP